MTVRLGDRNQRVGCCGGFLRFDFEPIDDRQHDRDHHESHRHDSDTSGKQTIEAIDQIGGVACSENKHRDEEHPRPIVDPIDAIPRNPAHPILDARRTQIDPLPNRKFPTIREKPDVGIGDRPAVQNRTDEPPGGCGTNLAQREKSGRRQLAGDLQSRIPVEDVIEHPGQEDREHSRSDRERNQRIFRHDGVAARRDQRRENVTREDPSEETDEDGHSSEVGDRIRMHLATAIGVVHDVKLDREPSDDWNGEERHEERHDQDRKKRVEQTGPLWHAPGKTTRPVDADQNLPHFLGTAPETV